MKRNAATIRRTLWRYGAQPRQRAEGLCGAITIMLMLTGATDSAILRAKGVQAYGIGSPITEEDNSRMHGNDERLSIEGLGKFVEYVYRAVTDVAAAK